tara:strand:+ start:211 stop:840 length:630 start_codon:yes stop_codon:yes gene_type:complete
MSSEMLSKGSSAIVTALILIIRGAAATEWRTTKGFCGGYQGTDVAKGHIVNGRFYEVFNVGGIVNWCEDAFIHVVPENALANISYCQKECEERRDDCAGFVEVYDANPAGTFNDANPAGSDDDTTLGRQVCAFAKDVTCGRPYIRDEQWYRTTGSYNSQERYTAFCHEKVTPSKFCSSAATSAAISAASTVSSVTAVGVVAAALYTASW